MQNKTNWLAIVAAAVAGIALGFLVYGLLFGDVWMAGNGITTNADQTIMYKDGKEIPVSPLPMIINAVALLIYAYLMNWLIIKTGETTLAGGVRVGAVVGTIGLLLHYVANRFAANPTSLSLVDGGYTLVLFVVIGAIVGGWRKK
ncbi:MAG: DUF1761 domain-containing protein [Bacteroidetes bacterium]|nr:MAG: DUF1761 domain-containing protein [Bacteroidota bacterium]